MVAATQSFAPLLTDEEREWAEAWEYAQTHTPDEMLNNGIQAVSDSLSSGEIDAERADLYLRVLMSQYVAVIATEQITGYLEQEFGPWTWPAYGARPRPLV